MAKYKRKRKYPTGGPIVPEPKFFYNGGMPHDPPYVDANGNPIEIPVFNQPTNPGMMGDVVPQMGILPPDPPQEGPTGGVTSMTPGVPKGKRRPHRSLFNRGRQTSSRGIPRDGFMNEYGGELGTDPPFTKAEFEQGMVQGIPNNDWRSTNDKYQYYLGEDRIEERSPANKILSGLGFVGLGTGIGYGLGNRRYNKTLPIYQQQYSDYVTDRTNMGGTWADPSNMMTFEEYQDFYNPGSEKKDYTKLGAIMGLGTSAMLTPLTNAAFNKINQNRRDKQARELREAMKAADDYGTGGYMKYANGGNMGQFSSVPVTEFNNGGTHEANPLGGIPQGPNALVEEGELKIRIPGTDQDFIVSPKIKLDKATAQEFGLPMKYVGKNMVDIFNKVLARKNFNQREGDTITNTTMKDNIAPYIEAHDYLTEKKNAEEEAMRQESFAADMDNMMTEYPDYMQAMMAQQQPQQGPSPEEQAMMEQQMMAQQGAPQGMPMMGMGGMMEYKNGGKRGLWDNIWAKRRRGERMRKKGEEGAPTEKALRESQNAMGGYLYKNGGINIDPAKRGTFRAQATKMGMGVQEAANTILNAPEGKYSSAMRKKANFAKNFAKEYGGYTYASGGKLPKNILRSRVEAHMSPAEADNYVKNYMGGGYLYENGGYRVSRSNKRKGKTHVVERISDGVKKYFGDPNLKNKPGTKAAKSAKARHKKNLNKNPFFRAYWNATWKHGGLMYENGGYNNAGFKALPDYVQAKIKGNSMANGGYNYSDFMMPGVPVQGVAASNYRYGGRYGCAPRKDFGGFMRGLGEAGYGVLQGTLSAIPGAGQFIDPIMEKGRVALQDATDATEEDKRKGEVISSIGNITGSLVTGNPAAALGQADEVADIARNVGPSDNADNETRKNLDAAANYIDTAGRFLPMLSGQIGKNKAPKGTLEGIDPETGLPISVNPNLPNYMYGGRKRYAYGGALSQPIKLMTYPHNQMIMANGGTMSDDDIRMILNFESTQGSAGGKGLSNYGIKVNQWGTKYPYLKDGVTEEEAIKFIRAEYLTDDMKELPVDAQKRLVDYTYNTGRNWKDLLLLNNGTIDLQGIRGNIDPKLWEDNKEAIIKSLKEEGAAAKLDKSKHSLMKDYWTNVAGNPEAYEKSAKDRIDMWSKGDTKFPGGNLGDSEKQFQYFMDNDILRVYSDGQPIKMDYKTGDEIPLELTENEYNYLIKAKRKENEKKGWDWEYPEYKNLAYSADKPYQEPGDDLTQSEMPEDWTPTADQVMEAVDAGIIETGISDTEATKEDNKKIYDWLNKSFTPIPVPSYQELMQDMPEEEIIIEDLAEEDPTAPEEETSDYRKDLQNIINISENDYIDQKIKENNPDYDELREGDKSDLRYKYMMEYRQAEEEARLKGMSPNVGKGVFTTQIRPGERPPITDKIQKDIDATIAAGGTVGYDDEGNLVMEAGKSGEGDFSRDVITGEGTEDEDVTTTPYNYYSPLTNMASGTANAGTEVKESFYPYALTGLQAGYNILAPILAKKFRGEDYVGDPSYMDAIDYDLSEERRELQREAAGARKNLKNIAGGVGAGAYLSNLGSMYDRFRRGVAGSYARENLLETQANMKIDKYNRMLDAQRARNIASINYGEDAQRRANILEGTTAALEQLKYPFDIRRGEQAGIDLTNAYLGEGSPYRMTYSTIGDQIRNRSAYGGYLPKKKKNG